MSAAGSAEIRPASGRWRPQINSSKVVFPHPLGPTTATISRGSARSESPSSAVSSPNRRVTPSTHTPPPPSRSGASISGSVTPFAGITHTGSKVSAGGVGRYLSRLTRQPP